MAHKKYARLNVSVLNNVLTKNTQIDTVLSFVPCVLSDVAVILQLLGYPLPENKQKLN